MGELLSELKCPEEQGGPTDAVLPVLPAEGADGRLLRFRAHWPQIPADAEALHAQALRRLLARAQELHHQVLEGWGHSGRGTQKPDYKQEIQAFLGWSPVTLMIY